MHNHFSQTDRFIFWAVFGSLIAYCLYGSIINNLLFIGKNGQVAHLHGITAWCLTAFFVLLGAGVWVRDFSKTLGRYRTKLEFFLLFASFAVLYLGWVYVPYNASP